MAKPPRRPPGRKTLPPDEAKAFVLSYRANNAHHSALARAAAAAGRAPAEEIHDRVARTLLEDHGKDEAELRIEALMRPIREAIREAVRALWAASPGGSAIPDPDRPLLLVHNLEVTTTEQPERDPEAGGQWRPPMRKERGEVARLLPVEMSVTRDADGMVVLIMLHGGHVIAETPIDPGQAQRLAEELLAACGDQREAPEPKPEPKSRRQRGRV